VKRIAFGCQLAADFAREGDPVQLLEQVSALPAQDAVQRFRITSLNGRHQLEEEVVAITALPSARLAQPAVQLSPAGLSTTRVRRYPPVCL
jgi:hypothetical protein